MDLLEEYEKRQADRAKPPKKEGLREKQKQLLRDEILDVALTLFSKHGYSKTTMQAIADDVGVGIATVFRTYRTKGTVYAAIVRRELEIVFDAGWEIVETPSGNMEQAITDLISVIFDILHRPSKLVRLPNKLRRNFWPAVVTGIEEVDEFVRWADREVQLQITGVLLHFLHGKASAQRITDVVMSIFYIFNGHYADMTFEDDATVDKAFDDMIRRVGYLLQSAERDIAAGQ